MQTIWSRTAQTRLCKCTFCLHSATAIARRTTTKPTRRKFKASDVYTACYSAVFATAALVDAKRKDTRRRQWDEAILEVKSELGADAKQHGSIGLEQLASMGDGMPLANSTTDEQEQVTWSPLSSSNWQSLNWLPPSKDHNKSLDDQLTVLNDHLREALTEEDPPPQKPHKYHKYLKPREPQTRVHLDRMQSMISNLVTNFLLNTKTFSERKMSNTQGFSSNKDPLASLKLGKTQLPEYYPLRGRIIEERVLLDDSIQVILNAQGSDAVNVDAMIAKICYNLLVSNAPPSIHTYNIMLVHFTQLKQHSFAQAIVDSFFEDSQFRPIPRTISAILNHYAAIGDRSSFRAVIRRMGAVDGDMRIQQRPLNGLTDPYIERWARKWRTTYRNGYLHAKAPRNALVYESLVLGSLRLFGLKRAIMYFKAALREGYDITVEVLAKVATACLDTFDRKASIALLSAIVCHWRQNQEPLIFEGSAAGRQCLLKLMDLCGIDHSIDIGSYQTMPSVGDREFREYFKPWLRSIHIESLSEKIERYTDLISTMSSMMASTVDKGFDSHRMVVEMLNYLDHQPQEKYQNRRKSLLAATELALTGSALQLKISEEKLISIIYASLPPHRQNIYDERFNQSVPTDPLQKANFILRLHLDPGELVGRRPVVRLEAIPERQNSARIAKVTEEHMSSDSDDTVLYNRTWVPPSRAEKWLVSLEGTKFQISSSPA